MNRKKSLSKVWIVLIGFLITSALRISTALADYPCQADLNGDGKVDSEDVVIMKNEMGREDCYKAPCQADLNGDGKVNNTDRRILKAELGRNDCASVNGDIPREDMGILQTRQDMEFDTAEGEEETTTRETVEEQGSEEVTAPSTSRFKDNGDGTITDPKTGLMWTKDANLPEDTMLFHHALDYIEEMNEGKYPNFGCTDWRLPTMEEALSLMETEKNSRDLYLHPCFSEHQPFIFLNEKRDPGGYWFCDFKQGTVFWASGTIPGGFGRLVRTV